MASLLLVVVLVGDLLVSVCLRTGGYAMPVISRQGNRFGAKRHGREITCRRNLGRRSGLEEIEAQPALANDQLELQAGSTPGITDTITATAILSETLATDPLLAAPSSLVTEPGQNPSASQAGNGQPDRSLWRVAEIVLALIALVCGLAAILLRRLHATG
jgi:hypothetical protein